MGPFLTLYYGVFRRQLDAHTVQVTEALRARLGLAGRLLHGGIFEEILFRWGLMGLLVWLGRSCLGQLMPSPSGWQFYWLGSCLRRSFTR